MAYNAQYTVTDIVNMVIDLISVIFYYTVQFAPVLVILSLLSAVAIKFKEAGGITGILG